MTRKVVIEHTVRTRSEVPMSAYPDMSDEQIIAFETDPDHVEPEMILDDIQTITTTVQIVDIDENTGQIEETD